MPDQTAYLVEFVGRLIVQVTGQQAELDALKAKRSQPMVRLERETGEFIEDATHVPEGWVKVRTEPVTLDVDVYRPPERPEVTRARLAAEAEGKPAPVRPDVPVRERPAGPVGPGATPPLSHSSLTPHTEKERHTPPVVNPTPAYQPVTTSNVTTSNVTTSVQPKVKPR